MILNKKYTIYFLSGFLLLRATSDVKSEDINPSIPEIFQNNGAGPLLRPYKGGGAGPLPFPGYQTIEVHKIPVFQKEEDIFVSLKDIFDKSDEIYFCKPDYEYIEQETAMICFRNIHEEKYFFVKYVNGYESHYKVSFELNPIINKLMLIVEPYHFRHFCDSDSRSTFTYPEITAEIRYPTVIVCLFGRKATIHEHFCI